MYETTMQKGQEIKVAVYYFVKRTRVMMFFCYLCANFTDKKRI